VSRDREGTSDKGGPGRLRYARHRLRRPGVARWLPLACFAGIFLALMGWVGAGRKKGRVPGAARARAEGLLRWARLAGRRLELPTHRFAIRHWRPLAIIILVVLASASLAASAGPRARELAGAPAPEAPDPWSQHGGEAGFPKERVSEVVALQWSPPSQPSPTPGPSFAPSQVEVPSPAPTAAPARVVADTAASEGEVTGLATWYGGADGYGMEDVMADGSYFDPNDPTIAAANRWPLSTRLRVCYLERCIEVQVRDRGAFSHALDLSYAAFGQLAPPSTGVITVTISRIG